MRMFFAAEWHDRAERINVTNPFNGEVIDTVPRGTAADVDAALATLVEGAKLMRKMASADRCRILRKTVELIQKRVRAKSR